MLSLSILWPFLFCIPSCDMIKFLFGHFSLLMRLIISFISVFLFIFSLGAHADTVDVTLKYTHPKDQGETIGTVTFQDGLYGMLITPNIKLPAGSYGFHIHTMPDCHDNGKAAGGHFDPLKTGEHKGPFSPSGHLGDLPVLMVDADGFSPLILAPKLKVKQTLGHALMIHEKGDNYSDTPSPLGGGGARMACGLIKGAN